MKIKFNILKKLLSVFTKPKKSLTECSFSPEQIELWRRASAKMPPAGFTIEEWGEFFEKVGKAGISIQNKVFNIEKGESRK